LKILHIFDHSIPLQSGYTFRSKAIIEQQRKFGWETVHVTGPKQLNCEETFEVIDGLPFHRTSLSNQFDMPGVREWQIVKVLAERIEEVVEEEKPNILHAHSPSLNGLAALKVARKRGLPLVYEIRAFWEDAAVDHGTSTEGGLRYLLTRASETYVLRRANAITCICDGLKQEMVSREIASSKITIIPNAVNPEKFHLTDTKDSSLIENLDLGGKLVLGFIGSFYAYEGLLFLVDALAGLVKGNPDIRLLLVGGGPQEAQVKAKVRALQLEKFVIMTGRVPHTEVEKYYSLVDIFIYPRLAMRLTDLVTPLKPLEAMAQKRLVIASDVGGHKELIKHGENGFLFRSEDKTSFQETVQGCIKEQESWNEIKSRAYEFIQTERSWGVSVANYRDLYEALLSTQGDVA